jgi:hypothetical protein
MSHSVSPLWNDNYSKSPGLPHTVRTYLTSLLEQDPSLRPKVAWTQTESKFGQDDLFRLSAERRKLMRTKVGAFIKSHRRSVQETVQSKIETYGQWKQYKKAYLLNRYQKLISSKAKTGPDPQGRTMVFTSIALLTNICWCDQLGWRVTASAEGTHNVTNNDFKLLVFGVFNISTKGARQFRPVASCIAEREREIAVLILLLNVQKAACVLFGMTIPRF